jgi:type III restriction enzyme
VAESSYLGYASQLPGLEDRDPYSHPSKFVQKLPGSTELAVVNERRPSEMLVVNRLREAVDDWRDSGYEGASKTTRRLFRWWFEEAEADGFRPYWGQREAIETIAYLVEIERCRDVMTPIDTYQDVPDPTLIEQGIEFQTTTDGVRQVLRRRSDGALDTIPLPDEGIARFALKMATGTGKTLVTALATVWSYFHARRESDSPLSPNILILAPNVIVFERLRTDFENGFVFHELPLIPHGWPFDLQVILRGESTEPAGAGNLFLTNIQQLYDSGSEFTPKNAVDALLGRKPSGDAGQGRRMLERIRDLDSLVVMNDEAHHVHDDDLEWSKTLSVLHQRLPRGLDLWLDFSATPKFQSGVYFPWIVCDYPLAQAVEDRIVKTPVILHMEDRPEPDHVTRDTVIEKYRDWLVSGVARLRDHEKHFESVETKPVLFVMCESVRHADKVGAWMVDPSGGAFGDDEVLVIHTDSGGEVRKGELDELRRLAREIDEPENPIKAVVSVLVLREGWDVRNVTLVLGLRPGTAAARILPEQAVGRGLRLMLGVGPDSDQVLEVMGTDAFENFVRELEKEGVHVQTERAPPKPPITIAPTQERFEFDIAIPRTEPFLMRRYTRIQDLAVDTRQALFDLAGVDGGDSIRLTAEAAAHGYELGEVTIADDRAPLAGEVLASIVQRIQSKAGLTLEFARLAPLVERYLRDRAFGETVDLDEESLRRFLRREDVRDAIASELAPALGELTAEREPISVEATPIRLFDTEPFLWRREHLRCEKTIFNFVASFNAFESEFAELLDRCDDVPRFAALAGVDFFLPYVKPSGATGRYFPDWVVVQGTGGGEVRWIVETKGRVWEGTERKDAAVEYWCDQITESTGERWQYLRVNQSLFKPETFDAYGDLLRLLGDDGQNGAGALPDPSTE